MDGICQICISFRIVKVISFSIVQYCFPGSQQHHYLPFLCWGVSCFQVRVPDVEFFVNLGDWPLEKRQPAERIHPIFSWCGSNNTRDIVMPTYDLTESVLETMGR